MLVKIQYFAMASEAAGRREEDLDCPSGALLEVVLRRVEETRPRMAAVLPHSRVAINGEFASKDANVAPKDIISILPPFSGG